MIPAMPIDASRHTLLCHNVHGRFFWDNQERVVTMMGVDDRMVGAGAFVVFQNSRTGEWSAKRRPEPRYDLNEPRF